MMSHHHAGRDRPLFDRMIEELAPVRPIRAWPAVLAMLVFGGVALAAVVMLFGARPDILAGDPHPMVVWRAGVLLLLGSICAAAALRTATPGVGQGNRAWAGAVAMAALVPLIALVTAIADPAAAARAIWWSSAIRCLWVSLAAATGFGAIMVLALRRGAPVAPERSGLLVGLAAGSLGVLVYSVHCLSNQIAYVGLWYTLAVLVAAAAGRLVVPRLVRW
jgi:hypothetical protein